MFNLSHLFGFVEDASDSFVIKRVSRLLEGFESHRFSSSVAFVDFSEAALANENSKLQFVVRDFYHSQLYDLLDRLHVAVISLFYFVWLFLTHLP